MEINSGGTPGPRLAEHLELPWNNVYGRLIGAPAQRELAETLVGLGWRARKSSWVDYEVEHDWVRIEMVDPAPAERLFSGVVDPDRVDELGEVFAGLGLRYSIELVTSEENPSLLRELAG